MQNRQIFFSIILPVFNGDRYLEESIRSVISQTFKDFELIIVDDASTDKSLEIAKKYQARDKRIKLIENKVNRSLPASLNIGHEIASGKYITWTSDDNILKSDFLLTYRKVAAVKEEDVFFSNYDIITSNGDFKREQISGPYENLVFGNYIGASFIYKQEVYYKLGGYKKDLFLVEDHDFFLRASLKFKFYHIDDNLYKYRNHDKSLTSKAQTDGAYYTKLIDNLKLMYQNPDFLLEPCTIEFIIGLYLRRPILDFYIKYKSQIDNNIFSFQRMLTDQTVNLGDQLEHLVRMNWLENDKYHSIRNLFRVILNCPRLISNSHHNRNATLRIIYLSLKHF